MKPNAPDLAAVVPRGLYAITPEWDDTARLSDAVSAAVRGGAVLVQYRNKPASPALRRRQGEALRTVCAAAGVPLIVNDDLALAVELGAGAHVGRDDAGSASARAALGPTPILGVSCYNELARVEPAIEAGASYLAFGAMFPSTTKPGAAHAPLALLSAAALRGLPVCAIGGITLERAPALIDAGADLLAVISDLFDRPDIEARAAAYAALFKRSTTKS